MHHPDRKVPLSDRFRLAPINVENKIPTPAAIEQYVGEVQNALWELEEQGFQALLVLRVDPRIFADTIMIRYNFLSIHNDEFKRMWEDFSNFK
uniref:Uncharacterized protein n=1 Tax=Peronospora matthiolae TaxID=2874970 RepID=A0AAV1UFK8_9STRA